MSKKVVKGKKAVQRFWAIRLFKDADVEIYRSATKPVVVPVDYNITDASGKTLYSVMELCPDANALFTFLEVGEIKEVTVKLG